MVKALSGVEGVMTEGATLEDTAKRIQERARDAQSVWHGRNDQIVFDRAMYSMTYKQRVPRVELYLANEARALVDKSAELLSAKPPVLRLPITKQDEPARRSMNKTERFLDGIFRDFSIRHRRQGRGNWLYEMAWYDVMGITCIYHCIRKGPGGDVHFRADLWDPIQVFPVYGESDLQELYRIYSMTPREAVNAAVYYGMDLEGAESLFGHSQAVTLPVVNAFWLEDIDTKRPTAMNAFLINGHMVKEPEAYDDWKGHIPVAIYPAGGVPYRDFDVLMSTKADPLGTSSTTSSVSVPEWPSTWGQPIFAANREAYIAMDKMLTWDMRIARKYAHGLHIEYTDDGGAHITSRDIETGGVAHLKVGDKVEALQPPTTPEQRREFLAYLSGAIQRGGMSNVAFGDIQQELAGVAVERLIAATKSTIAPYVETAQFAIAQTLLGLLREFREGAYGKVSLAVRQRYGGEQLQVFDEEFSAKDISETAYLEVLLPLGMPDQRLQNMTVARTAIPGNQPLMSPQTIFEDILEGQDWDLEQDKIKESMADVDPAMAALNVIDGLRVKRAAAAKMGDAERAQYIDTIIKMRLASMQSAAGGATAPPGPVSPRNSEPRPEVMPAEAGGAPPDRMMAQRPQKPNMPLVEKRLRGMGMLKGV